MQMKIGTCLEDFVQNLNNCSEYSPSLNEYALRNNINKSIINS